jgi:hypothetical protein
MRRAVAALAFAAAGLAHGEEGARWYARIENDVIFGTDRWYTSGVRIARVKDDVEYALVHEVYTPEAKQWLPGRDDRIPVGRLLFSGAWHGRDADAYRTVEFFGGVRGPAARGEETTERIHEIIPAPAVDWSRQLENEFDGGIAFAHSQRFGFLTGHVGAVLGNQVIFGHLGLEARTGTLEAPGATLRFAPTPPMPARGVSGWSAFAGASIRGVARNEFIGRNYDPFGAPIERKRAVGRLAYGGAYAGRVGTVELEIVHESAEFEGQRRAHGFGSLALHIDF